MTAGHDGPAERPSDEVAASRSGNGRVPVAVLGSGNIGTDLLIKLQRSGVLEPVIVAGIDPASEGLALARDRGVATTADGIDGLLREAPDVRMVFDATSAKAHVRHARILASAGIVAIDLTPAARGPYVVPPVNLDALSAAPNLNLISCGGQATVPIVAAAARVAPVDYAEIVSTISSRSAGPGTRQNIDEFTETTAAGLERVGGAARGKAIIILNPAEPPILMTNTVHMRVPRAPELRDALDASIRAMVADVAGYVPGYRLRADPVFDGERVSVYLEVTGAGDYLPVYAGNLDIMTAAAVAVGERLARLEGSAVTTAPARAVPASTVPAS